MSLLLGRSLTIAGSPEADLLIVDAQNQYPALTLQRQSSGIYWLSSPGKSPQRVNLGTDYIIRGIKLRLENLPIRLGPVLGVWIALLVVVGLWQGSRVQPLMTERNQARPQAAQLTPNDEGRLTNLLFTNQLRPLTLTQWRRSIAEQPLFGWLKLLDCKGGFFSRETNLTASILQQIYSLTQELQFAIKQAHHLGRHQLVEQLFEDAARLVPLPETHQPEEIRRQLQHSYDQLNLLWEMHRDAQR